MCYRPRPDLERSSVRKPANEETARKLRKLEAELARLRREHGKVMKA